MTKQTNYVATVTDANSQFPPKGEAIPNSNRGLVTSASGQTQGSVGAKDSWYIDTNAQPLASYPNNRLPRWQDLIPLSCDFTSNVKQLPTVSSIAYNKTIRLSLVNGTSAMSTLLFNVRNTTLKDFLLPYYENNEGEYLYKVQVPPFTPSRRPLRAMIGGGTVDNQRCTFIFPQNNFGDDNYYGVNYYWGLSNVVNGVFVPSAQVWPYYAEDLDPVLQSSSIYARGGTFNMIESSPNTVSSQFWNAVYNGTGSYSGYMGFSMNSYQTLFNNVPTNISVNALTDLIIQALKLVGYTF